jgi:hypothetical protein
VRSPAFRCIARVFAVILLVWTTADLFHYGLCVHGHDWIGAFAAAGVRSASAESETHHADCDDCFCCSHGMITQVPFSIPIHHGLVCRVPDVSAGRPHAVTHAFYHPPLA